MWKTFFKVLLIGAVFTPAPIIVSVHATFSSNDRQTLDAYPSNKSFAKSKEDDIQQLQKIEKQSADILKKIDKFVTLNQENSRKILQLEAEKSRLNELVKRHREENEQLEKENIQNLQNIEKQTEDLLKKINAFFTPEQKKSKTVQQLNDNNRHVQNADTQEKKDYEQENSTCTQLQNNCKKMKNDYDEIKNNYDKMKNDYDEMKNDYEELQGVFEPSKEDSSKPQKYIKKIEEYCAKGILLETKNQINIIKNTDDEEKIKKATQTIKEKIQEFGKTIQKRALLKIQTDLKDVLNKDTVKNKLLKKIFKPGDRDTLFEKMFEEKSTAGSPPQENNAIAS